MSTSETPNSEINEVAEKLFNESQKSQVMNTYCPRCKEVYSKNKVDSKNIPREWIKRDVAICDLAEELEKELTATKARNDELESALDEKNSQLSDYDYCRDKIDKLEADLDAWKKMAGELYQAAKKIPPYPSPAHQLQTPNWWDLNAATIDYEKLLK